jgi:RimJ/RimL family protein N-acetyltransferase
VGNFAGEVSQHHDFFSLRTCACRVEGLTTMAFDYASLTDRLERVYSRRLALRPLALSDAWPLYTATRNPLFNRHLLWKAPDSERELLQRVQAIIDAMRRGRLSALSAVVRETGEWVSLFRFLPHQLDRGAVEMGIWTHDRFWHGSYSLELGRMCVDAAFEVSDADTLIGAAAPDNRASCRLIRTVGLREYRLVERPTEIGPPVALQEFRLTREEWEALPHTEPSYELVSFIDPPEMMRRRRPAANVEVENLDDAKPMQRDAA